jgi:hypothetical protein
MADQDPIQDTQDPNVEVPGDTGAADIVDRTGEQMPRQSHDGLESDDRDAGESPDDENDAVQDDRRQDHARTAPVSDF